jgi:O-methyltransferase involved in polyketide biosynthesis
LCARRWPGSPVKYFALDLGEDEWPDFRDWVRAAGTSRTLVLMEGLTPYIDDCRMSDFLRLLSAHLAPGSHVAYDFKISGVDDHFGRGERTRRPFRLPLDREAVARYHGLRNYRLMHLEQSDALSLRLMPDLAVGGVPLFREDAVIQVEITG